ncbi:patatin-like phospholipase family protein [Sorangium sp. So ce381]|uniref:patatin-like phospholipase family protein n=1 Tax=unclassified Sorangium TaxID=2621164 RepID=UPI003F5ADEDA
MSEQDNPAAYSLKSRNAPEPPVAIVLTGAGARGAYEAGFVSRLLPELGKTRPTILIGTSAGAINAALLASVAAKTQEEASSELVERWQRIHKEMVLGPVFRSLVRAGAEYAAGLLLGTNGPTSLLDTRPLRSSLANRSLIDWDVINDNLQFNPKDCGSDGRVDGNKPRIDVLAVATTESGSGRTKIFYQMGTNSRANTPRNDDDRAIDYVPTQLSSDHVLASAAIPVLFPPARIGSPARGHFYVDGGVRLNAPLQPAIDFGAKGIIVVSTDSRRYGASAAVNIHEWPTLQDHALQMMRVITSDRMIEEVRKQLEANMQAEANETAGAPPIPIIFGGPSGQDDVGSVAARALEDILRGTRKLQHRDLALLYWLTSVSPHSRPDVLSYVLFNEKFISDALRAGIQDADELIEDAYTFSASQGTSNEAKLWNALQIKHNEKKLSRPLSCP